MICWLVALAPLFRSLGLVFCLLASIHSNDDNTLCLRQKKQRRDYKPDLIPADEVKPEAETGKLLLNGFDNEGRPILYLRPGKENTKESPRQIRHLVFHMCVRWFLFFVFYCLFFCVVSLSRYLLRTSIRSECGGPE